MMPKLYKEELPQVKTSEMGIKKVLTRMQGLEKGWKIGFEPTTS